MQVMRSYFPSILALAQSLLRSLDLCVVPFGGHMYKHAFTAFDSYCQQVRAWCGRSAARGCVCVPALGHVGTCSRYLTAVCPAGGGGLAGHPRVQRRERGGGRGPGAAVRAGDAEAGRHGALRHFRQGRRGLRQ